MKEKTVQPVVKADEKLQHRFFWNWDHSTNWCLNTVGRQNCGVSNNYTKPAEEFVRDFTRMIDWCAAHGIDAIGVVGLLRDCHGGEESVRRLCGYAREKGVRVYLIAGLYTYGGLWYEGDNKLSLNTFLQKNPQCIGKDLDGSPLYIRFRYPHGHRAQPMACSSSREVNEYIVDALVLLFMKIPELGGIQMETGDCCPVCLCPRCRERRAAMRGGERVLPEISLSDMACIYPEAANAVRSISKDAWIICENYLHFRENPVYADKDNPSVQRLLTLPEGTFLQWGGDRRIKQDIWKTTPILPEHFRKYHNIQRFHRGTQWDGGRHTLAVDRIREMCRLSYTSGMDSISMFGECSPFHANTEINYLALQYFADHPLNSVDQFAADVMAGMLGGEGLAQEYLNFAVMNKTPEKIPAAEKRIAEIIGRTKDFQTLRRWTYLASFLHSYYWEHCQSDPSKTGEKINLDFV